MTGVVVREVAFNTMDISVVFIRALSMEMLNVLVDTQINHTHIHTHTQTHTLTHTHTHSHTNTHTHTHTHTHVHSNYY